MKITRIILIASVILLFLLSGCATNNENSSEITEKISKETNENVSKETTENASKESKSYKSINDYFGDFTGQHVKTSVLHISKNGNLADLNLKIFISAELREKMMNTENPIYFTFGDIIGSSKIGNMLVESPPAFQIEIASTDGMYTLSQQLKLKEKLSDEEIKTLLSPENYILQVLNEEKLAVANFIGLETPTIQ